MCTPGLLPRRPDSTSSGLNGPISQEEQAPRPLSIDPWEGILGEALVGCRCVIPLRRPATTPSRVVGIEDEERSSETPRLAGLPELDLLDSLLLTPVYELRSRVNATKGRPR